MDAPYLEKTGGGTVLPGKPITVDTIALALYPDTMLIRYQTDSAMTHYYQRIRMVFSLPKSSQETQKI